MGYDLDAQRPVWRLEFADHPGLVLRVRLPGVGALAKTQRLLPLLESGRRPDLIRAMDALAGSFADAVVSWTVKRGGDLVPVTRREVRRLDLELAVMLVKAWANHARPVEPPAEVAEPGWSEGEARLLALAMPPIAEDPDEEVVAG